MRRDVGASFAAHIALLVCLLLLMAAFRTRPVRDGVLDVPLAARRGVGTTSPDAGGQPWAVAAILGRFLLLLSKESVPDPERKIRFGAIGYVRRLVAWLGEDLYVVIPIL